MNVKRRGRPPEGRNRKPRNIQMTDEIYAWLVYRGNGKACEGLESIYVSAGVKGRLRVPK